MNEPWYLPFVHPFVIFFVYGPVLFGCLIGLFGLFDRKSKGDDK